MLSPQVQRPLALEQTFLFELVVCLREDLPSLRRLAVIMSFINDVGTPLVLLGAVRQANVGTSILKYPFFLFQWPEWCRFVVAHVADHRLQVDASFIVGFQAKFQAVEKIFFLYKSNEMKKIENFFLYNSNEIKKLQVLLKQMVLRK